MAEQGFILDIDTKFLKNLEQADKALSKSIMSANGLTNAFKDTTLGSGRFAEQIQTLLTQMQKLGGFKIDGNGFAVINTNAMSATDKVNLLIANLERFQTVIRSMNQSGQTTWLKPEEMLNPASLKKAIADVQDVLKSDKTLKLIDTQQLSNELKAYQSALKEIQRSDKDRVESAAKKTRDALSNISKLYKQEATESRKYANAYTKAMQMSEGTVTQRTNKISRLREVEKLLSEDEKKYAKEIENVRKAISALTNANTQASNSTKELNNNQKGLIDTAGQLKRQLTTLFSVSAIKGYINKIASVRGEFELHQKSLQAMLQSRAEADALWEKTVALAVRSPFRVKELVTYTKQLAAYRVESNKLYETNKMLADISAGLGVQMSRLILAFGQVKAANYLRGTELRQFSEAGINVLGELADYFTEIEGKAVTVGEVFERVSKRMVSFADVEAVLKKVTDKGGIFYNMQEIQAETLKGQMANLKDSIDLMMNDIGKQNEGLLKGTVAMVRAVVDNWQILASAIQSGLIIYGLFTAAKIRDAIATGAWSSANLAATASTNGLVGGIARLITMLKGLKLAMLENPLTAVVVVLSTAAVAIHKYIARQRELNRIYQEGVGKIVSTRVEAESYAKALVELSKRQEELSKSNENLEKSSDGYKKNQEEIAKIENDRKTILKELKNIAPDFAEKTRTIANDTEALVRVAKEYNDELRSRLALEYQLKEAPEDVETYEERRSKYMSNLGKFEASRARVYGAVDAILSGEIDIPRSDGKGLSLDMRAALEGFIESTDSYEVKLRKLRDEISKVANAAERFTLLRNIGFQELWDLDTARANMVAAEKTITKTFDSLIDDFKLSDYGKEIMNGVFSEEVDVKNNATNSLIKYWERILDDKKVVGQLRESVQNTLAKSFGIDWKKIENVNLETWQRAYNDLLQDLLDGKPIGGLTNITQNTTQVADQLSLIESKIKDVKGVIASSKVEGQGVITEEMLDEANRALPILEALRAFLGGTEKNAQQNGAQEKNLSKRISLIKEMRSEYEKLRKDMGDTAATEEVLRSYRKTFGMAFEGTGISLTDFFRTDEGVIAKLGELSSIAEKEGKEAKISLAREIGQIDVRLRVRSLEESDKEFIQSIESMFSGYELSLELGKLNIPTSFAKDYFGVDTSSLDDIKNTLYEAKAKYDIGSDRYKKIEEFEKKITDLEAKEQKERLKKYLVYARDAVGERAKIKLEELKKLQEIELTFGAQSTPEKQRAVEKVRSDSYQATKKLDWEEFQKSDTFVSLFQDLDMASESLINHALTKLQEFKDSWKDMPHEEMKSIVSQIEKLEMQLIEVSDPFKTARDLRRSLKGGPSLEELQIDRINKETEISGLEDELSMLEQIAQLKSEGKDFDADQLAIQNDRVDLFGIESDELSKMISANKEKSSLLATDVKNINKQINDYSKLSKAYQKQAQLLGKARDIAGDLYGAFKDVYEVLGGSDDSLTAIFAEMGMNMIDSVVNCLTLQLELKATQTAAQGAGSAIQSALGPIGWAVMAIQILTQAFAAFSKAHDKKIEKQIQRIAERVEDLQDRWERLGELMDKVSSSRGIVAYTKEAAENMKAQIEAYDQMIALEQTKKKTDHDKIKEWEDAQKELRDDYKELIEEGFSTATSGILDDVLSATRGFVDAWHDAFLETGSGVSALHNNFTDLFKDIMRQQAALQIVNPYVNKYKEWLQEYVDIEGGDSELTLDEAREWANKVKSTMPELNNLLSNFFAGTEELMQEQGELSELSKGIQGVTESTAQILEALLNSMRFFVADTNASVKNIESAFMSSDVSRNPILNELQQHTQLIRSIESMFDSVIGHGGSTHTGAYLKVFM